MELSSAIWQEWGSEQTLAGKYTSSSDSSWSQTADCNSIPFTTIHWTGKRVSIVCIKFALPINLVGASAGATSLYLSLSLSFSPSIYWCWWASQAYKCLMCNSLTAIKNCSNEQMYFSCFCMRWIWVQPVAVMRPHKLRSQPGFELVQLLVSEQTIQNLLMKLRRWHCLYLQHLYYTFSQRNGMANVCSTLHLISLRLENINNKWAQHCV